MPLPVTKSSTLPVTLLVWKPKVAVWQSQVTVKQNYCHVPHWKHPSLRTKISRLAEPKYVEMGNRNFATLLLKVKGYKLIPLSSSDF